MTPGNKGRLIAAIALPCLLLHPAAGRCAPVEASRSATTNLPHISIVAAGTKGSPIVLIPGLSSPRAVWDGVVPMLAKTHRVYVVQVNGFAGDAPGANLQPGMLDGIVADLDGFIAGNRLDQPAIVGHSMGGLIALMLAHAHPDHVSRLMIVDTLPYIGTLFFPAATVPLVEPQAKEMRDQIAATYGKPANVATVEAAANRLALKPASRALVAGWAEAADPRVTAEAFYEDMTTDLRPDMATIRAPITLVYPWNDAGAAKPMADALYRTAYASAPHVSYVNIGDSAHFVMLDQPAAFATALGAFADAH